MIHYHLNHVLISFRSCTKKQKKKMRDEEGRNFEKGNEEIKDKKKWEYEREVIIWRNE